MFIFWSKRLRPSLSYTCCIYLVLLCSLVTGSASADMSSWMEDNQRALRYHTLQSLSLPSSHDAAMYYQDTDEVEISIEDLYMKANASVFGIGLVSLDLTDVGFPSASPFKGVVSGGELIDLFNAIKSAIADFDHRCIRVEVLGREIFNECINLGILAIFDTLTKPYYRLATDAPDSLSITQNLSLYNQLQSGARMFDLRPKVLDGELFAHHSQRLKDMDKSIDENGSRSIYNPFGADIEIYSYSFEASITARSISSTGPRFSEVLGDIRRYMQDGHKELVVLDMKGYWKGFNGDEFGTADYHMVAQAIQSQLGPWLVYADDLYGAGTMPATTLLSRLTLSKILQERGQVLVVLQPSFPDHDPSLGLWPGSPIKNRGTFANTNELNDMRSDQRSNFESAGNSRFALWWTLTCQQLSLEDLGPGSLCSVRDLAGEANPHLRDFVSSLGLLDNGAPLLRAASSGLNSPSNSDTPSGLTTLHEIWVDFFEETEAGSIAIELNLSNAPRRPPYPIRSGEPIPTMGIYTLGLMTLLLGFLGVRAQRKKGKS